MIVCDIRNKCPDLHNKEGLTGPGEERENEKYIRITHSRSEFNDEHCYVYNKSKKYSCGAYLFFAVFSYKLAHKRQKQYHRQICAYGNKCVKTRLFIEILKEIVVNGLSIHLEADKKH